MSADEPIRKRIVINLDAPPSGVPVGSRIPGSNPTAPQPAGSRWPKVLGILAALIVVIVGAAAVGGYLWFRYYQTTPAYSLALAFDAAQRNDMAALDAQIDSDAITSSMVNDVRQKASSRYGLALSGPLQRQIDNLLPSLLPGVKETVRAEIAREMAELLKSDRKPVILVALTISSLAKIVTEGDIANVTGTVRDRNFALKMRRDGDRWKVIDFKDDALVQRVVDDMMKKLPAIGRDLDLLKKLQAPSPSRRR